MPPYLLLWRKLSAKQLMLLNCGVGEDSWDSPGCKETQPVHPKGDQSWVFIGRTDVEAETPILWPPEAKSWLIRKDCDARKDWGQEEKGTTEDEMVGWHHRLNGHGFGWTPGVSDGQGGLACCGSWGWKESDMTEWLNWTELNERKIEGKKGKVLTTWSNQNASFCPVHVGSPRAQGYDPGLISLLCHLLTLNLGKLLTSSMPQFPPL